MYGKIFESMFSGTLYGRVEAISVFTALIVFADEDGFVDMSFDALVGRTGYPREFVLVGLTELLAADEYSRTPDDDGRRVRPVTPCHATSPERINGFVIVNHARYRAIATAADKREANRARQRRHRQKSAEFPEDSTSVSPPSRAVTPRHAPSQNVTPSETETDAESKAGTESKSKPKHSARSAKLTKDALFDDFWAVVHHKVKKLGARTAFERAVNRVKQQRDCAITEAARYVTDRMKAFSSTPAAHPTEHTPIHPTTWLNNGCYDDDPECWSTAANGDSEAAQAAERENNRKRNQDRFAKAREATAAREAKRHG